jgi:hypothetical protein
MATASSNKNGTSKPPAKRTAQTEKPQTPSGHGVIHPGRTGPKLAPKTPIPGNARQARQETNDTKAPSREPDRTTSRKPSTAPRTQ